MNIPLSPCVPENLVSRDGFSRPVPRQPAHLHTQAEYGAYLRNSSRVPRQHPFIYIKTAIRHRVSPEFIGSRNCVPMAFTAESPPAQASKPQGSSKRVLPWPVTMDQLIFASLSHTHYWYEVGMLKVPAVVENDHACAGRDGRTRLARPNYQKARTGTGKYSFFLLFR